VIRLVLIAASARIRRALESRLHAQRTAVVQSFASLEDAVEAFEEKPPDVLLIDATSSSDQAHDPLDAVLAPLQESGHARRIPVIVLLPEPSSEDLSRAFRIGIRAVLPSNAEPRQLAAAVEAAASGLLVLSAAELPAQVVFANANSDDDSFVEALTPREKDVLHLLAAGLGNKEIAARLNISDHTVKYHVASILGKLAASSRTEAVSTAMRRGLILF
jgi:two-component system, NarL family, response regulator YdfI